MSESQNREREEEWERSEKVSEKVRERGGKEGERKKRETDRDVGLCNSYSISFTRGIFVTRDWPLESSAG